MCAVSYVHDYGSSLPSQWWEKVQHIDQFKKLLEAAEEFDRKTGQPDCVDPEKQALLERISGLEKRLRELEAEKNTLQPKLLLSTAHINRGDAKG